jgi:hypothetical protein
MRSIPRSRLDIIRLAYPNARIEYRDGYEVVVIPTYDPTTDAVGEIVLRLVADAPEGKPQVGETRRDSHGNTYTIVPPPLPKVRTGPKTDDDDGSA